MMIFLQESNGLKSTLNLTLNNHKKINTNCKRMKIIDKLVIIAMGLFICFKISWETPLPLIGLIPILYAIIYLIIRGFNDNDDCV
jgi:hypothetical protein